MARGNRALRAALGAVAGGFSGFAADKEYRDQQERLAQEQARQEARDEEARKAAARALEMQAASLAERGWITSDAATAKRGEAMNALGSIASMGMGQMMGGALPPSGLSKAGVKALSDNSLKMNTDRRTTFNGQEYILPETDDERTDRVTREKAERDQQKLDNEQKRLRSLADAARKGGKKSQAAFELALENPSAYNALFDENTSSGVGMRQASLREQEMQNELAQQEAEGIAFLNDNRQNDAVMRGYGAILSRNPKATMGQIGYALMQQGAKQALLENREANTGRAEAGAALTKSKIRAPRSGALPPGVRAPASAGKPVSSAGTPAQTDELDAAFDRYTSKKR